jgi:hypothetical protein
MRAPAILMASLGLTLSVCTFAQNPGEHNRYKWKDAEGNLHYDDALPPAAVQFGYDIVNKNGMVIKHVDRAKTPEELKADKEAAAKVAGEKRAAEEQAQHDQQMLAAYPTEQDLARAQQGQLDSLDQEVHAIQLSLDSQEKSLTDMLGRAADLERTGKPVPPALQKQIETQRATVSTQKDYIAGKMKERADTVTHFGEELVHYRELHTKAPAKQ